MKSKNMNYLYNVEYYDNLDMTIEDNNGKDKCVFGINDSKGQDNGITQRTDEILKWFKFPDGRVFNLPDTKLGIKRFSLFSSYPGVMMGVGNPHSIKIEGAMQNGFTFDYVTGLPFLPGSSLKGILKSVFSSGKFAKAKEQYIKGYLPERAKGINVNALRDHIFGSDDEKTPGKGIFYGVFPKNVVLQDDFITPHMDEFTNPIPVRMLKIAPGVEFEFIFSCEPYENITADDISELFKKIILDVGIGAKTNVGFGVMTEKEPLRKCGNRE